MKLHVFSKPAVGLFAAIALCGPVLPSSAFGCDGAQCTSDNHRNDGIFYDASLRSRYEFVNWFDPGTAGVDNDYAFPHLKGQAGVGYRWGGLTGYAQGQYSQAFDLDSTYNGPAGVYKSTNSGQSAPGDVYLRQGYLSYSRMDENSGLDAIVGRFLYHSGLEVKKHGNATVDSVKASRIADRLIGPFDYTFGRSYDGMGTNFRLEECLGTFSTYLLRPTQGGFETDGFTPIRDIDMLTAAYTSSPDGWPGDGEFQAFYYYYDDEREVVKTDNRDLASRTADIDSVQVATYGFHWVQAYPGESVTFDSLVWGAIQGGSWGNQDHLAGAFALEGGAKFNEVYAKPWVRLGWNWSSGDDDPTDGDHSTFFQITPTARLYAKTPFYNLMNNQDLFVQGVFTPIDELKLGTTVHQLWLTEKNDLLYSGAGANRQIGGFGYSGFSGGGATDIGTLLDFEASYALTENVTMSLYYGHLFGGDVTDNAFSDGDLDYGYAELTLKL